MKFPQIALFTSLYLANAQIPCDTNCAQTRQELLKNFSPKPHSAQHIHNPFIPPLQPPTKPQSKKLEPLHLEAIINKKALIDGIWYEIGAHKDFTLLEITQDSVLLKRGKKTERLYLRDS
ncbi:hypothetical protein [Helicobacter himalayensis]|uniref:hypothetical protein n=1 Tax=Helicobacter himalayensis TaxID=1591088 RepID=UPI0008362EFC|nr:hypothetical protein [Helicobacter himalayensis]